MKIGVYVGSFNPIHKGHITIINYLIENKYVDKIIIIPTGNYWHKKDLIDISDRINMAKIYENDNLIVDNTLNNFDYTYQILNELKKQYPNYELNLIIGDDNLEKFHLWKNIDEILKHKVIVIPRNNNYQKYINKFFEKDCFVVTNQFPIQNISSTLIRELIENNKIDEVLEYIDKEVLDYIIRNKLYNKQLVFSQRTLKLEKK